MYIPGFQPLEVTWELSQLPREGTVEAFWSVRNFNFGDTFNGTVEEESVWPHGLRKLSFGRCFNAPMISLASASSLQYLAFGRKLTSNRRNHVALVFADSQVRMGLQSSAGCRFVAVVAKGNHLRQRVKSASGGRSLTIIYPAAFLRGRFRRAC